MRVEQVTTCTTRAAETWAHLLRCQREGVPAFPWALDFAQDGYGDLAEACAAVEECAQRHLDAHPDDHGARRLLGEWLTACGDERGEGLCALAACKKWCRFWKVNQGWCWLRDVTAWDRAEFEHTELGGNWYDAGIETVVHQLFGTRQAAEDAASLAFTRLPAERRAQLLRGEM
jgi:hypothetical protein